MMKIKRASLCQGKGSLSHNLRLFTANNVDKTRTKDNIVFVNIPQQEMYERLFGGAVNEYNARQKRNDRKITVSYYEHQFGRSYSPNVVTSADKRKSFYEDVVQIGDMKDTGVGTVDAETAKAALTEYMNGFEQRNPNFKVFCAVLHMDEATPHLHIDYVPIGHYSRGIPVQNGIAQALKEMGFGIGKDAIARWRQSEYEVLKSICMRYDIELAPPKKSVGSKSVELYKEEKRLEEKVEKLREMELAADSTEVPYKKRLIGGGYILTEQEYAEFTAEKKAVSVQRVDAERKVMEAEEAVRQTESRRLVLSEREDAFEKTKASEEKKIQEKVKQTNLDLLDARVAKEKAKELAAEQQDINEVLQKTKAELRKAEEEKHRYREYAFENAHLKREIAAYDQKHSEEVERLTADYSEKIKNLTEEIADKEKVISEQASGIAELEAQITERDTIISKSKDTIKTWEGLYDNACAVGEYACRKLGRDFDRCLDMKIDNYRLSYIFGDERSR
ncbi:MAG: plasmid recombination protein [Oscillospiraceae bacterium]|nr:plasmid recombination protein [Oscillospiraceae bacterium]